MSSGRQGPHRRLGNGMQLEYPTLDQHSPQSKTLGGEMVTHVLREVVQTEGLQDAGGVFARGEKESMLSMRQVRRELPKGGWLMKQLKRDHLNDPKLESRRVLRCEGSTFSIFQQ